MAYSEPELVVPALRAISESATGLSTTQLISALRVRLKPSRHDVEVIAGRKDDYFSQKVRNLTSHRTLENSGFATRLTTRRGGFLITDAGRSYLADNEPTFEALLDQGFSDAERNKAAEKSYRNIVIEEGRLRPAMTKLYQRSRSLSSYARNVYSDANGRIRCHGCDFEGSEKYGEVGLGLIEMHHTEPLSIRGGRAYQADRDQAVARIVPLCPNCHRMIHRRDRYLMTIDDLKSRTGYREENVG